MFYVIIPHWWKLPFLAALLYLAATRVHLQQNNLYSTYVPGEFPNVSCAGVNIAARTIDGSCNSLSQPAMGSKEMRFMRMVPIEHTWQENSTDSLFTPNPRTISSKLFKRKSFQPAPSLNLFAAAWIQFQTHDWFNHGANDYTNILHIPVPSDDLLYARQKTIPLARTLKDTHPDRPSTYNNSVTHWWDLSPIYGSDEATHATLRTYVGGKMILAEDGLLRAGPDGIDITGFSQNWWVGLSLMHNIWVKEHNAVCDMFAQKYPTWNDQKIFDQARLVTTALNAKIHTIEWTPAILANPVLAEAMNINWNGAEPDFAKGFIPHLSMLQFPMAEELLQTWQGIVGSPPEFNGVEFAHSEEFVSIYRFHSLLPDEISITDHLTGKPTGKSYNIKQYSFSGAQDVVRGNNFSDVVYTFGTSNPGALILGNYPSQLMDLNEPGIPYTLDMGVVDIVRDRERGVPRYNEFRRLFSLVPAKTMDDISDNPVDVAALRSVYGDDVESVDLLAGTLAESPRPNGYAFSNTQFQVFILAASRRLMTDRFFTTDFNAETYTQEGLDWIKRNDFRSVIGRAIPELNDDVHSVDNAFKPWVTK